MSEEEKLKAAKIKADEEKVKADAARLKAAGVAAKPEEIVDSVVVGNTAMYQHR